MSQNRRQDALNGFRSGKYDILVATDIAARGIDVSKVSHVINFDMPDTVDAYTHRIGRTGRALQTGDAFTFAVKEDGPLLRSIEYVLGAPIERKHLADFDYGNFDPENQFSGQPSSEVPGGIKPKGTHVSTQKQGAKEPSYGRRGKRRSPSGRGVRRLG